MAKKKLSPKPSTAAKVWPRPASLKARLTALVIGPVIFLVLLEVTLRLLNIGIPATFWVKWAGGDQTVYVVNRHYCELFVPKHLSRRPVFSALSPVKSESVRRIVVLGGSAAYGDPEPAYGFCRQLEFLLNQHAEGVSFKVINAAVTSMNSHVARRIARDTVAHQPDLFIVFMGNNEVVGPYGPPTLPAILYGNSTWIDWSIAVKKGTRLGQWMAKAAERMSSRRPEDEQWLGMERFLQHEITATDPKLASCYRHFKRNLQHILDHAQACGARVLICTPPVNLQDCPPFGSQHRPDLSIQQKSEWDTLWQTGRQLELDDDWQAALNAYDQAAGLDDQYADLRFSRGRCALQLGQRDLALQEFQAACDLDTLRFRADSHIHQALFETAVLAGVPVLDLQQTLQEACEDDVLGAEFLVDHVHLTPEGNFRSAWLALAHVGELLAGSLKPVTESYEYWLGQTQRRLLYGPVERYELALTMYRRKTIPPFTGQLDHERDMAVLREQLFQRRHESKGQGWSESVLREMSDRYDIDVEVNRRYAQWLQRQRRGGEAIDRLGRILVRRPYDTDAQVAQAYAYAFLGARDQALMVLTDAEGAIRYSLEQAYRLLGSYYIQHGRYKDAQWAYEALYKLAPDHDHDVLVNLASAASHCNDLPAMKGYVDQAIALNPDSVQAMITLGNYFAKIKDVSTACDWFERAVQADPYHYLAHIGLGIQSLRQGDNNRGVQHIKQAVLLKPDFAEGYNFLAVIYQQANQPELARQYEALRDLFKP